MLGEIEIRKMRLYWKDQLKNATIRGLKPPIHLVITVLEEILEIKDGE